MIYKRENPDQTVLPNQRESHNDKDTKGSPNPGSSKESGRSDQSSDGLENNPDEDRPEIEEDSTIREKV